MTRKLLFTVTAAIALAGCSEGSPLEPQYANVNAAGRVVPSEPLDATMSIEGMNVVVRWVDNSTNERRFEIQRREGVDELPWGEVYVKLERNTTSFTDTNVQFDTRYRYRVRACVRRADCSAWVTTNSLVTPASDPSVAAPITTTVLSSTSVEVGWLDEAGDETHFQVQRRTRIDTGLWADWALLASPGVDTTSLIDSSASPNTGYRYRVRECNGATCTPWVTGPLVETPAS